MGVLLGLVVYHVFRAPTIRGEGLTPVAELAAWITELRGAHTVEGTPEQTGTRKVTRAEVPVTRGIRKRREATPVEMPAEPVVEEPGEPIPVETNQELPEPSATVIPMLAAATPAEGYRRNVTRRCQADEEQLRLF
jgi:hypothetical protein